MTTNKPEVFTFNSLSEEYVSLSDYERLQADHERLQAECDRLRKDAERLDWLADPENEIGEVLLPTEAVEQNPHSMRAAIDAAMEMQN